MCLRQTKFKQSHAELGLDLFLDNHSPMNEQLCKEEHHEKNELF